MSRKARLVGPFLVFIVVVFSTDQVCAVFAITTLWAGDPLDQIMNTKFGDPGWSSVYMDYWDHIAQCFSLPKLHSRRGSATYKHIHCM